MAGVQPAKPAGRLRAADGAAEAGPAAVFLCAPSLPSPLPPGARRASADAGLAARGAEAAQPPAEDAGAGCGVTPASLKHLRRQNATLAEGLERAGTEVAALQARLQDEQGRASGLAASLAEAEHREAALQQEVAVGRGRENAQCRRIEELSLLNARLEESLSLREAEVLTQRRTLAQLRLRQAADAFRSEGRHAAARGAAPAEAASGEPQPQARGGALADALAGKIQVHVSIPRVTVAYNGAPPLEVSLASCLGQDRIRHFLDRNLLPHLEPLWLRMDDLDEAPDGTSKEAYSAKIMDALAQSIQVFVAKAAKSTPDDPGGAPQTAAAPPELVGGGGAPLGVCGPLGVAPRASDPAHGPVPEASKLLLLRPPPLLPPSGGLVVEDEHLEGP
ncbi:unnamed protein product [Prorocentrum cordatum]|uniref:Uncharacterized protein n=1 Tax=Prorocentrum cordatum TaxID=2364126 RepID=A0ABN9VCL2_9DINO|nr:unnamed protein product [Polarella glacialis]